MKKKFFEFTHLLQSKLNRQRKRSIVFISLLSVLILLFLSSSLYKRLTSSTVGALNEALIVQTVRVKTVSMPELIETVGSVSAENEVMIKAPATGKVQELLVESGSWVKAGSKLLNLIGAPEVRAPFDGFLGDWRVKSGEIVQSNADLIELVNAEQLILTYKVPEQYASKLDLDQKVEISVKSFPDKLFTGVVKYVAPMVDKKTYTILMKAKVKNAEQDLWPGMSARVRHYLSIDPNALVIPESALMLTLEGYEVFTVIDEKIVKRKVVIGSKEQGRVKIKMGLTVDEPVVITRTDTIKEGKSAKAVNWQGQW